jgi:predicted RNase H-like nuclease
LSSSGYIKRESALGFTLIALLVTEVRRSALTRQREICGLSVKLSRSSGVHGRLPVGNLIAELDMEGIDHLIAAVDGCKGGWVIAQGAIELDGKAGPNSGSRPLELSESIDLFHCKNFSDVLDATKQCDVVLIDMPIGLSDGKRSGAGGNSSDDWPRPCDLMAKQALGGKRSSLFLAPPRGCLIAENPRAFQEMHRELTGVGASLPVWGIVPKIIEVDGLMDWKVQRRVHEYHPELAWCRLAGTELPKKRSPEGRAVRWQLLEQWIGKNALGQTAEWRAARPSQVAEDDLLDALVGLVVGLTFGQFRLCGEPQRDSTGLLMEIIF